VRGGRSPSLRPIRGLRRPSFLPNRRPVRQGCRHSYAGSADRSTLLGTSATGSARMATVRRLESGPFGWAGRPSRHALRSHSQGSGGSASRIMRRSVVAGQPLSPRPLSASTGGVRPGPVHDGCFLAVSVTVPRVCLRARASTRGSHPRVVGTSWCHGRERIVGMTLVQSGGLTARRIARRAVLR
jgi:hypothetical protein